MILLILGVPIVFAIGIASVVALLYLDIDLVMLAQRTIAGTESFPLLAVPGFILAGDLMTAGGVSRHLVTVANRLVRHVTGGLGMVSRPFIDVFRLLVRLSAGDDRNRGVHNDP